MGTLGTHARKSRATVRKVPSPRASTQAQAAEENKALTDILRVISSSPGDLQLVFDTILSHARRLCGGSAAVLWQYDGTQLRLAARDGGSKEGEAYLRSHPLALGKYNPTPQAALEKRTVHVLDVFADRKYRALVPKDSFRSLPNATTVLAVPLLRQNELFGVISIWRFEKQPFTRQQIAMVETFASQAALAIHNVRLHNETRAALERQTATSEILRVISDSPTNVQPVFDAIARSAVTLCGGLFGAVFRYDGEHAHFAAHYGFSAEALALMQRRFPRIPEGLIALTLLDSAVSHSPDVLSDPQSANPELHRTLGVRSFLGVPMLLDARPIGAISVWRRDPGPFTDAQIALLRTFADQAAIAIENVRLFNETKEALEQQTATAEVLGVIASSRSDIQPVLDAVGRNAARLCEANNAVIFRLEGDLLRQVASYGGIPTSSHPSEGLPVDRSRVTGRAVVDRQTIHVHDLAAETSEFPEGSRDARRDGHRTTLATPLMRDGAPIGAILIRRMEVRPFSENQIALLKTFADQAAIAIENVRLFNETKEALEQQTASSDILRIISSSPTDLGPVFDAILESATRLCGAHLGVLNLFEGEMCRTVAQRGGSPEFAKWVLERGAFKPVAAMARILADRRPFHAPDAREGPGFKARDPNAMKFVELGGARSYLAVPLLKEGTVLGSINIFRPEVRPFNDKEIDLVSTFANQAVIAIENVRLFNQLKNSNSTLREALEQQTATSELLKVIGRSNFDLQPVFETLVENAVRLCGAERGFVFRFDGKVLRYTVGHNVSPELREFFERNPITPGRDSNAGRAVIERRTVHNHDVLSDPEYGYGGVRVDPYRTVLAVPMFRADELLGVIVIYRHEVRPFTADQIALMETFADQAAIAIENVRLFNETKEALERQTATAEILKVISASPTDVQPVFETIARNAVALCGSVFSCVFRYDGELMHFAAANNLAPHSVATLRARYPGPPDASLVGGRAILTGEVARIEDIDADPDYDRRFAAEGGWRRNMAVPMQRDGKPVGAIVVAWAEPGPIPKDQEDLLKTFADQAVIAIENARLFTELDSRNRELRVALEQQTATSELLKVIGRSTFELRPVFETLAENAARLCEADRALIFRFEEQRLRIVATHNTPAEFRAFVEQNPIPLGRGSSVGRAASERRTVHIPDVWADPEHHYKGRQVDPHRTVLAVPMLKVTELLGVIFIYRHEVRPFADSQIALVETFADQAVIAIENARLFKELQERTEALTRSVRQLTALGEVGHAISSTLDLETVLKTIVSRAVQLTGLDAGAIYEYDEATEQFHLRAAENISEDVLEVLRSTPIRKGDGAVGATAMAREPIQVSETQDESYKSRLRDLIIRTGRRALLAVPLMHEDRIVGALAVQRNTPGPFAPEVVDLLKTFATQSALAIQNARLFREIAEKSRQLEVASHHKSQFLASMSHELRTPLNALLGFNEMILGEVYGEVPGDMKPPLAQMQASGKHLLRLINNVLDLAKIEAGRMELALSDYSVHDTVESVRSALRPLAADKGLELLAAVPQDIPLAYGDPGRITQCLMNLAGNSLKFTKAGKVEISVALDDGRLRYSVADTGIGIPADKIDSLFTEFKQTDATIASEYGGTGLGLSITKKFIEMHGGRIWVESEPGRGSTFRFEVPLRAQEAKAA